MPILNAYTEVSAKKTMEEIEALLAKNGARRVAKHYERGEATGLTFTLATPFGDQTFVLPANVEAMYLILLDDYETGHLDRRSLATPEHARDVAWRNILVWVKAQLALVALGQVSFDQVMLPFLIDRTGQTLYLALANGRLLLPSGEGRER